MLAGLRAQMELTVSGMEAFAAWAAGDEAAAEVVRAREHEADEARRALRTALRDALITPISPEDVFILSQLLDRILNGAKDVVREAEVMDMPTDEAMAEMAERLLEGTTHLSRAFNAIAVHGGKDSHRAATQAADDATKSARRMEKVYRQAMGGLLTLELTDGSSHAHVREVIGRRELYRRLSRIADGLVDVADRVWYAAVKEM